MRVQAGEAVAIVGESGVRKEHDIGSPASVL